MLGDVVDTYGLSRWVVVKEYLPTSTRPSDIQKIFTNFKIPKEARILPQDIRIENYRGSKIVDLSSTLTEPCPEWSAFHFKFFYTRTIHGVFDWFKGEPQVSRRHNHLLAGALPFRFDPDVLGPEIVDAGT
jgi:hypothetical protein